jgi:tetratricopeptide (TPR) repeat protein
MLADNVKKSGDYALVYEEIQFMEKTLSPDNLITAVFWADAYFTINIVNRILEVIKKGEVEVPADEKNRIKGECLFIRSLLYFDMVRYWGNPNNGLGVPLVLEPTGIEAQPARTATTDVYTQVIADLQEAINLLPRKIKTRADSYAAEALLSRVYFYNKNYAEAATAASHIIESGEFSLVADVRENYFDYDTAFLDEIVFALRSAPNDYSCGTLNGYYREASTPRFSPSNKMMEVFRFLSGEDDQRFTRLFVTIEGKTYTTKYDSRYMHIPLIRLAELYLTRAECRLEAGYEAGAIADVNVIRERAGLDPVTSLTFSNMYWERFQELFFEGDNFHNQKRLQRAKVSNMELPWDSPRLLYKIPQREIDVNPNLVQN